MFVCVLVEEKKRERNKKRSCEHDCVRENTPISMYSSTPTWIYLEENFLLYAAMPQRSSAHKLIGKVNMQGVGIFIFYATARDRHIAQLFVTAVMYAKRAIEMCVRDIVR